MFIKKTLKCVKVVFFSSDATLLLYLSVSKYARRLTNPNKVFLYTHRNQSNSIKYLLIYVKFPKSSCNLILSKYNHDMHRWPSKFFIVAIIVLKLIRCLLNKLLYIDLNGELNLFERVVFLSNAKVELFS